VALLTDDATAISDGAGLTHKIVRYSVPERVAMALRAAFKPTAAKRRLAGGSPELHAGMVNGSPAVIAALPDRVVGVLVLQLRDDKIAAVTAVAHPDRLGRLSGLWLRRPPEGPVIASW
jgi:RNA polymerase sigma-70 factor (ECF subfamily)